MENVVPTLHLYFRHRDPALRLAGLQIASRMAATQQGALILVPNSGVNIEEAIQNKIW
jgi:hypothetical protein